VEWYAAPLHIQKIYLFLLQRGTKTYHIIIGGLLVATMETAASVGACHFIRQNYIKLYQNFIKIYKIIYITDTDYLIYISVIKHFDIVLYCFILYMAKLMMKGRK
jgi:hypothetical protein